MQNLQKSTKKNKSVFTFKNYLYYRENDMIGMHECLRCENFISGERSPYTWKCKAFPDGIPYERFSNINESNRDYCNNGIGFVPQKEETESEPAK